MAAVSEMVNPFLSGEEKAKSLPIDGLFIYTYEFIMQTLLNWIFIVSVCQQIMNIIVLKESQY